jgi:hypothetical protein
MSSVNFDYFVERGSILNEMARPTTIFKFKELNEPYVNLRKFYKTNINPDENPGPLGVYVFRYWRDSIEEFASPEQEDEWINTASEGSVKAADIVKYVAVSHINDILQTAKDESPEKFNEVLDVLLSAATDFETFKRYVLNIKKESKSFVKKYRQSKKEEITDLDPDYITELGLKLKPYIDKMNKLMFPRIIARSKGSKITSVKDPEILTSEIILELFTQMQGKKFLYKESDENIDYDKSEKPKQWVSRSKISSDTSPTPKSLDQYLSKISVAEFNASIGTLITLIQSKLDKGIGQSLAGVLDIFNRIKKHPNVSENLVGLLNKTEEILNERLSTQTDEYFGYDGDIYEQVLDDEKLRYDFNSYKTAINKIKESDAESQKIKVDNRISELMNKLEGKYDLYHKTDSKYVPTKSDRSEINPFSDELETSKILVNVCRKDLEQWKNNYESQLKNRFKPQTISPSEFSSKNAQLITRLKTEAGNLKEIQDKYNKWESDKLQSSEGSESEQPIGESVMSYMVEQFQKDSKFGKQRGEFVERGFKKVKNYGHWLMIND